MSKQLEKNKKGFTIIEVMIVLAIAGLIMLIVFLAVPALQRNSRNTARRNDASRIGAAANSFEANNNAALPSSTADAKAIISEAGTLSQYSGLTENSAANCAPGSLVAGDLTVCAGPTGAATVQFTAPANDGIVIATKAACGTNGSVGAGSAKQMALVYTLEGGSGTVLSCLNI